MPDPLRVRIPRLDIAAAVDPLRLGRSSELVPPRYGRAGWYKDGPEPGERGRAVIVGHLDSRTGRDVFWNLHSARRGDKVFVEVSKGIEVRFVVQRVGRYARARFPTDRVYGGPRKTPELRLITCAGAYDRAKGGYQDNVVVFAKIG
jgi:LPXTG-site transpeptidase (sortase) family protein